MPNDWIIDVLTDLKAVAKQNGMDATAASLEDASLVALVELTALQAHPQSGESAAPEAEQTQESGNVTPLFAKRTYA